MSDSMTNKLSNSFGLLHTDNKFKWLFVVVFLLKMP